MLGKRIYNRYAHAVQPARHLIGGVIELASCMQHGHNDLGSGNFLCRVHVNRYAAAIVGDRYAVIKMNDHIYSVAVSCHGLIDAVVDHLIDQMVQACRIRAADIHGGPFTHCL